MSDTKSTRGFEWLRRPAPHVGYYRGELVLCVLLSVIGQIPVGLLPLVQQVIVVHPGRGNIELGPVHGSHGAASQEARRARAH